MVEHCLGMTGIVVRFYVRAPCCNNTTTIISEKC